jgi:hypothetical protein
MKTTIPLFNTKWSLKKIYSDGTEESINTKAFIRLDKEKAALVEMGAVMVLEALLQLATMK